VVEDDRDSEGDRGPLVVDGDVGGVWINLLIVSFLLFITGFMDVLGSLRLALPWDAGSRFVTPALVAGSFVLLCWATLQVHRRRGKVTFHDERIVFDEGSERSAAIPWFEVVAFDDASADYIVLVPRKRVTWLGLSVPTPTERDRVAVLDLLVKRSIPRR
jgi:hypothetical protein